jgi:4-hydroxy-3-methylbut-2-enyl diphosphate reductase IspH
MLTDPFRKENGKLEQHLTPVLDTTCPFTRDVHRDEIQHLEQGLIRRE